jgi:FtsP/CotA-like multicopper oxidase with cupredoxin domain
MGFSLKSSGLWLGLAASAFLPGVFAKCGHSKFELVLTWETASPDGTPRKVIHANGQFPAPTLEIDEGDRVEVTVFNKLPFNTTLHFHGIHQDTTPWSDGVPGVTQRHIQPGKSFVYEWDANQYGSYWYHAHQMGQIEDGLYGPLVIRPKKSRATPLSAIPGDADAIAKAVKKPRQLLIGDWRKKTSTEIMKIEHDANMELPCYDSILFNGKGSTICWTEEVIKSLITPQQQNTLNAAGGAMSPKGCLPPALIAKVIAPNHTVYPEKIPAENLNVCEPSKGETEVISVTKAKSEKEKWVAIDVISATGLLAFSFSIDSLPIWVYAVDGEYIVPKQVNALPVSNGDRYSILVKLDEAADYPIRVASTQNTQLIAATAVLKYRIIDSTVAPKTSGFAPWVRDNGLPLNGTIVYNVAQQKQFEVKTMGAKADATYKLNMKTAGASWQWALNNAGFSAAVSDHGSQGVALFKTPGPAGDLTINTKKNQWIDLIFITATKPTPPHPIHKHGNKMFLLGSGQGAFPWATVEEAKAAGAPLNLVDPPRRDAVVTPQASPANATWTVVRYHASQPGAWLMHCHIQSHLGGGMALLIQDGVDAWPKVPAVYANYS